jgi:hypothetical protein
MIMHLSDGRDVILTRITGKRNGLSVEFWQAEYIYLRNKMAGPLTRSEMGFGASVNEAVIALYDRLADAGELDSNLTPCTSCGKGYRLISMVSSFIEHDDKCPAMADPGEDA